MLWQLFLTQRFFPPSVVPIRKNWSRNRYLSDVFKVSFPPSFILWTAIAPCSNFFLKPPEGPKISYLHYCSHCQNGRLLFPIPYNLHNATRGISEFCPIRGIDRRTGMPEWRAYPLGFFSIAHFNFLLSQWLKNWLRYRYLSCIHIRFGASFSPLGWIDGRSWLRYGF